MTKAPTRVERTLATRRRMARAAYDLFCRNGYLGTTITAVAEEARVAVPTIYYTFGTKAALLGDALGAAIVGFDHWRPPPAEPIQIDQILPWHQWWAGFSAAPTSREALGIFVDRGSGILQRVAPLVSALHGATGDAEAAEIVGASEERRIESYRGVVHVLAGKPDGLRPGVSRATATDILAALFSAEAYHLLSARGWTRVRTAKFFDDLLAGQLLADPVAGRPEAIRAAP